MRARTVHRCTECGAEAPRWLGRCPDCGSWGSLVEAGPPAGAHRVPAPPPADLTTALPIADVDPAGAARRATGVGELDRVLGGGLVPGSVTLIGGEPGMGKSTLLLQALGRLADGGARCLLVGAEESAQQVRLRAERLGTLGPELFLAADTSLAHVLAHVEANAPDVLAIDSIQAIVDADSPGTPGSLSQVRACAQQLVRLAKDRSLTTLLVGHVTKDGHLAGPRTLEHVVDTVLSFTGDRHHALRYLHTLKHRFGSTQEVGLLEMTASGLTDVPDPSALFLSGHRAGTPGSVVAPILEGARPMLVEVQGLVADMPSATPTPRRSATGIEAARFAMLLGILQQRAGLFVANRDVYASVAGGVRVSEPAADLAIAFAIASAACDIGPVPGTVVTGEIGLAGEVRQVPSIARRLAEAARLGFTRAIVPEGTPPVDGIELFPVADARGGTAHDVRDGHVAGGHAPPGTRPRPRRPRPPRPPCPASTAKRPRTAPTDTNRASRATPTTAPALRMSSSTCAGGGTSKYPEDPAPARGPRNH